jgi:DNA-binding LytR/AlgR family response regulator
MMEKPVVLIVESEVLIRMSAVRMVEDAGFSCVDVGNADAAIEILESRRDVRAVFTDINMSGSMDGLKLAEATSGSNMGDRLPVDGRFILKPYSGEQVAAALSELFSSHPTPRRLFGDDGRNCAKVA